MRIAALFLCLAVALPLQAATWYVRPASWTPDDASDGTSYETAFDGFSDIDWESIQPGDTLYICDTHQYPGDFFNGSNSIQASGAQGNPITIRGDLADHPGVMISARKWTTDAWTDLEDGSYRCPTTSTQPGGCWQGDPTGTPELLKYVASSELVSSTEGSWWYDSTAESQYYRCLYVNPYGTTLDEDVYAITAPAMPINSYDHLVIDGLRLFGGSDGVVRLCKSGHGAADDVHDITIRNCEIAFGPYTGIYAAGYNSQTILVEDCVIHDVPSGTYTIASGGCTARNWTLRRVEVYSGRDTRNCYTADARDRGAFAFQDAQDLLIEYCYVHDMASQGVGNYATDEGYTRNTTIRYNRFENFADDDDANYHRGVSKNGSNDVNWAVRTANWQIYGNLFINLAPNTDTDAMGNGAAIRLKGPGGTADQQPKIYNNTIYDCYMGLYWQNTSPDPGGGLDFRNNICLSPKAGGYHVYMTSTEGTRSLTMDNNCWYPNTSGDNNTFRWYGSTATNWADFKAKAAADSLTIEANSILADPLLADPADGKLWLQAGSPCIDAGTNLNTDIKQALDTSSAWPDLVRNLDQDQSGSRWEMGAYVHHPDVSHTISIGAPNGAVTKSPEKSDYGQGERVALLAVPDAGYNFAGWSGDLTGSSNPATVVMDSSKTITANFVVDTPALFTLSVTAGGGTVVRSPSRNDYQAGESVTLQAVPSTGYHFTGWSGDVSGASNPAVLVMDRNRAVTAHFVANSYSLTVSVTNGTADKNPNRASYTHGETVTLSAVPASGYEFDGWAGALTGQSNPAVLLMDSDKVVTAGFRPSSLDIKPPAAIACEPQPGAIQVPLNSLVTLRVADDGRGVDGNTVVISLGDTIVYTGNVSSYHSAVGVCRRIGAPAGYTYAFQSDQQFRFDQTVGVTVQAADLAGNAMPTYSYSFATEMRAFGRNLEAARGLDELDKGEPATGRDHAGDIWVVWEAGPVGTRDIYAARLAHGSDSFHDPVRLTTGAGDGCNPALTIDENNRFYVVWQDDRRGNWDIYVRTSMDGSTWSEERRLTDSESNHVHPAIAVDHQSPGRAYVAWQDDEAGHQDIYVASSQDGFATKATWRVTSDASGQTDPQIVVDAYGTVYLVWTDGRNGTDDIYGASSLAGPWTNVPFVTGAGHQNSPALAVETGGTALHLAWVDDASGNQDIRYACTDGLPAGPLAGVNVVDDTLGAHQSAPAVATAGSAGADLRVFLCWRDERNIALNKSGGDADLYFVEVGTATATNILVGDGGAGSDQGEPSMGIDGSGHPYLVWTDDRTSVKDIYYCGSTYMDPEALASNLVSSAAGGTVGRTAIAGLDDVSVVIPAGACLVDVTVAITPIVNPQPNSAASVIPYDFGPSGLEFNLPVTITIPYAVAAFGGTPPVPCWYDSRTGTVSQQGIAGVETLYISSAIHALRFQATHFTPYVLLPASTTPRDASGSPSGGGGCSLSPVSGVSEALEFFIPYVLLASAMVALRRRDGSRCPVSGDKSGGN